SKVRERFGGRLKFAFSGGAALSPEVARFIDNLGILVFEGYGLTETSPIACANRPDARKIGSVGKPIPEVEIIIDTSVVDDDSDDGEILIKGPNVMQGYHKLADETAAVMREDGAFRSGDRGRMDAEGFVYITGRIKEQYKLENGRYVAPAPLEEQLKLSGYINQVVVDGTNRPYNVALVVPDFETLRPWSTAQGLGSMSDADLCAHPAVTALITAEIAERSAEFKSFEIPRKFTLVAEEFTTDNGMLTPTLKLKRRVIMGSHGDKLAALYDEG
ncbi:MAG: AMP-binding protein, partial [Myxococcota bacterium]|nr:AMP-binding protein [Myxococcota bacterium]